MSEIPEKYTIDNAKNDIQNLQDQNKYDFQEINRLARLIQEYDKRVLQSINFNNQINKKIQDDYEKCKKIIIDENATVALDEKIDDKYNSNKSKIEEMELSNTNKFLEINNKFSNVGLQLDTIETQIQDFINIDMFDNGDDITDTTRFINAFNYCKTNSVRLQLNAKTYYINADRIEYDGSFSLQGVGKDKTVIVCNNRGDIFINTPKTTNIRNGIISNLCINGNYKCKIGILFFGKKNIIRDCVIKNFTDYQIKLGDGDFRAWETEITKCFIQGCENNINDKNKLPDTLVWYSLSATDNFMSDCVIANCSDISIIDDGANNRFLNVHTYGYPDNHRQKTCFKLNGAYSSILQCQLDTPKENGVILTGYNNNISLNNCFWNKEFQSTGIENFVVIDNTGGRCSNNIITSNMSTYFGVNLSKNIKIIGDDNGNLIYNNGGNISNDNGNKLFVHPDKTVVLNLGTWYNSLGIERNLINLKKSIELQNGWINVDNQLYVTKKNNGDNVFCGKIKNGNESNNTILFTLPYQYRPENYITLPILYFTTNNEYKIGVIGISSSGNVEILNIKDCQYIIFDNISYK